MDKAYITIFKVLNIYGPYNERVPFWDSLRASQFLKKENVVIGGDLNFTLGVHDIWGLNARSDPLVAFFKTLLRNLKLVDLDPQNIKPTWSNRRVGDDRVAKRLDRFLLSESLLEKDFQFKHWVDSGADSNH